ncbi:MAG: helix-turn-helix transcriptional regulator [Tissierellia bacterium]|nr:helix-turn-helix transcriptional regulator [Tissierellia bacterium]
MDNNTYTDKELAIFNGVIDLINRGANIYSVTVSEIAKASGVGKGTIYEYFSSKEEVISKAILYKMRKETDYAIARVESKTNFKDKYYEALKIIVENFDNKFSTINFLLSTGRLDKLYAYLVDEEELIPCYISRIESLIDRLLLMGYEEEIISIEESQYYKRMVIISSIAAFLNYVNNREGYCDIDTEKAMDYCYKMVVKALN